MADVTRALAITQDDALANPQQMDLEPGWKIIGTATAAQGSVKLYRMTGSDGLYIIDVGGTKKTPAEVLTILVQLVEDLRRGGKVWNTTLPGTGAFTDLPDGTWTPAA